MREAGNGVRAGPSTSLGSRNPEPAGTSIALWTRTHPSLATVSSSRQLGMAMTPRLLMSAVRSVSGQAAFPPPPLVAQPCTRDETGETTGMRQEKQLGWEATEKARPMESQCASGPNAHGPPWRSQFPETKFLYQAPWHHHDSNQHYHQHYRQHDHHHQHLYQEPSSTSSARPVCQSSPSFTSKRRSFVRRRTTTCS